MANGLALSVDQMLLYFKPKMVSNLKSSVRIILKCALQICFCVALGNAIMQLLAKEITISILYELLYLHVWF